MRHQLQRLARYRESAPLLLPEAQQDAITLRCWIVIGRAGATTLLFFSNTMRQFPAQVGFVSRELFL
jgi:hypothetical protein